MLVKQNHELEKKTLRVRHETYLFSFDDSSIGKDYDLSFSVNLNLFSNTVWVTRVIYVSCEPSLKSCINDSVVVQPEHVYSTAILLTQKERKC